MSLPLAFVGSLTTGVQVEEAASRITSDLRFDLDERRRTPTWTEALRRFITRADEAGVLVMVNGVVGNNNRRKLNPDEFRGFALADDLAPLVFINGADSKAAQMFTLANELARAHLDRRIRLSDAGPASSPSTDVEQWCNQVAAELLVPAAVLREQFRRDAPISEEARRPARIFKVSALVALRRVHDIGGLTRDEFWTAYREELDRLGAVDTGSGGDFSLTHAARVSKRFARASS